MVQIYTTSQAQVIAGFMRVLTLDGAKMSLSQGNTTAVHITLTTASGSVIHRLKVEADGTISKDEKIIRVNPSEVDAARQHMIAAMQNEG